MRSHTTAASLPEVHSSVVTAKPTLIKRMLAFAGPAYLVSVGYMDPGNWASDLAGGSSFGYRLLWVVVLSNFMAILLQTLAARLGIVAGRDLAQACREAYPKPVCNALWVLCEIAIAACDLAEVLGAAIGLKILFGLPLLAGVILTAADTILVLWLSRFGIRVIEAAILSLIAIMTGCFLVELFLAHPQLHEVLSGLAPRLDNKSLYIAVTIVGATVMPHNLYLHSALVQTRRIGRSSAERREACRFNLMDSVVALNGALIVNAAILVLAAAVFFKHGVIVERDRAGARDAGAAARHHTRERAVRGRPAGQRTIVHAYRHLCGPDRDGRISGSAHAPLDAASDHANACDYPGRGRDLALRGTIDSVAAAAEPGDHQHAASLRRHPAGALYRRQAADGRVRQPDLGQASGMEHGGRYPGAESLADGRFGHALAEGFALAWR